MISEAKLLTDVECVVELSGGERRLRITISLEDVIRDGRFLIPDLHFQYGIEGADDVSRDFGIENWRGGIISGARYAFRLLKEPFRRIRLHEMSGRLDSTQISIVASATALAIGSLFGREDSIPPIEGWDIAKSLIPRHKDEESKN